MTRFYRPTPPARSLWYSGRYESSGLSTTTVPAAQAQPGRIDWDVLPGQVAFLLNAVSALTLRRS